MFTLIAVWLLLMVLAWALFAALVSIEPSLPQPVKMAQKRRNRSQGPVYVTVQSNGYRLNIPIPQWQKIADLPVPGSWGNDCEVIGCPSHAWTYRRMADTWFPSKRLILADAFRMLLKLDGSFVERIQ